MVLLCTALSYWDNPIRVAFRIEDCRNIFAIWNLEFAIEKENGKWKFCKRTLSIGRSDDDENGFHFKDTFELIKNNFKLI